MLFADSFYNSYPNLPAYWALGDRAGSVTGLGGNVADVRYFTRPTGYPDPVYPLATQEENNSPNGLSQWNPMGIGVFDFSNNGVTDPALIAKGNQIAYQYGADLVLDMQFKNACQSLSSLQSQLEGAVKSDKLDEAQKQKLQEVIDEIKALKEEVTEKAKSGNLKREEKEAVMGQIQELTEKASKAADEVIAEVKEKAENGEGSDDKVDDKDDDKTEGAGSAKSDEEAKKQDKKNKDEAAGIVGLIFEAVDGIGTNNEQVNQAIEQINKDNIIDVFDTWNKNYKAKEGSLVKRLYEEEFWYNGGNKNVETMLAIFEEKAKELDIYSELIKEFTTVKSEIGAAWNTDEKKVAEAMEKIYETVKKTEAEQKTKAESEKAKKAEAEADKKAETKRKEQEKVDKQRNQFASDMREILGDNEAEVSENVKYENGKFVIRIKGKDYYGKDYLELANALDKAGYAPEKYLKKAAAKKAA